MRLKSIQLKPIHLTEEEAIEKGLYNVIGKELDDKYMKVLEDLVLNKDVIALGKIAEDIEEEGKKLATIEIKRRNIASEEEFNKIKNNLNLIDENFEDVGNDYSNRIDEIDVTTNELNNDEEINENIEEYQDDFEEEDDLDNLEFPGDIEEDILDDGEGEE